MRNRRNNNVKNIKDYIVPIIAFLLIFMFIYLIFSGGDDKDTNDSSSNIENTVNKKGISINLGSIDTEAEIIDKSNKKISIKDSDILSAGESIVVKSGDVSFSIPDKADFKLNTNGKINYLSDNSIELESNALWVETKGPQKISTRYTNINIGKNSIVNIEQNEVSTTVYLLKGTVEVKNLVGVSTFLAPGKKILISNKNASNKDLDMNMLKEDFDAYFKISDWYLKNIASLELLNNEELSSEKTQTGVVTGTGKITQEKKNQNIIGLLNFDNIYDEGSVNSESTNISGKFEDERIAKIVINGKNAVINLENKTFNLVGVDTSKKENDIAIKIYDTDENILGKYLYTLYYSGGNKLDNSNSFAKVNTKPYPVNGEDFIISIPTVKNGETFSSENTFYGTVKNPNVKSVTVNGYNLKTFNGKTFRYHAYKKFGTLGEGVNNYEIKYYDTNGKVILKKYITINKVSKKIKKDKKISKEAGLN